MQTRSYCTKRPLQGAIVPDNIKGPVHHGAMGMGYMFLVEAAGVEPYL